MQFGIELKVVDAEGAELPRDGVSIGEVLMRGNVVMKGYLNNPKTRGVDNIKVIAYFHKPSVDQTQCHRVSAGDPVVKPNWFTQERCWEYLVRRARSGSHGLLRRNQAA